MLTITALPAFSDNYIWMAARAGQALVVDPGDAAPVESALRARDLRLAAILITHHHLDHIGGLAQLARHAVPIYGPRAERSSIPGLTHLLDDGDELDVPALDLHFDVLAVPGHTLGHIAYHARDEQGDFLFCGDTMFSAGCGRLFEGTAEQLHHSLARLNAYSAATRIYCTHEYTLSNLKFAKAVEPDNPAVDDYLQHVSALRSRDVPTLPSDLARERAVNPFLRAHEPAIMRAASTHAGHDLTDAVSVFGALRRWKDGFRAT